MKKLVIVLMIVILLTGCSNQEINQEKASAVEENLRSFDLKYPIVDDFDGYFQYTNEDNQKVPVLVHVTFNYNNHEYNKISDVINALNISIIGITGEVNISQSFNDADAFSQMIDVWHQPNRVIESIEEEPGIAYLKKTFEDQMTIVNIDDETIVYEVQDQIDNVFFSLRFTEDQKNNRIVLELDSIH